MSETRSTTALARAAHLYYVDGLTQAAVAEQLHTTRSNVSRMLTAARDQGIVRIRVVEPLARHDRLEDALTRVFPHLREAWVLSAEALHEDDLSCIGRLAAQWVETSVEDGLHVILSWGRTLAAMVDAVEVDHLVQVSVGQIGGDLQVDASYCSHDIVRTLAAALGGAYEYVHAPALCPNAAVADELRQSPEIAEQLGRAARADVALVGIGGFGHGFSAMLLRSAHLSEDEADDLSSLRPVGDIGARFFDADGEPVHGPLEDRVLGLTLGQLRTIETVVGVASGHRKGAGILGALTGELVDVLVCDQSAAAAVLRLWDERQRSKEQVA